MKLTVYKRSKEKKSELTKIRNSGDIPAVLYDAKKNAPLFVKGSDFAALLRNTPKGRLSTQVVELSLDGTVTKALIKEVQYHRTTYRPEHIDFMPLQDKTPIILNIPVECENIAECSGVKKGGMLRQLLRKVKVKCLVKDIPASFKADVAPLEIGQGLRLKDLTFPAGVKPLAKLQELFVTVGKK